MRTVLVVAAAALAGAAVGWTVATLIDKYLRPWG
jgi:hypothetical protein